MEKVNELMFRIVGLPSVTVKMLLFGVKVKDRFALCSVSVSMCFLHDLPSGEIREEVRVSRRPPWRFPSCWCALFSPESLRFRPP